MSHVTRAMWVRREIAEGNRVIRHIERTGELPTGYLWATAIRRPSRRHRATFCWRRGHKGWWRSVHPAARPFVRDMFYATLGALFGRQDPIEFEDAADGL